MFNEIYSDRNEDKINQLTKEIVISWSTDFPAAKCAFVALTSVGWEAAADVAEHAAAAPVVVDAADVGS